MPLAALFGVGGRVGKAVALKFLQGGYQVAVVSRTGASGLDEEVEGHKGFLRQYRADLGKAEDAVRVWKEIKHDFKTPVSFVFVSKTTPARTLPRCSSRRRFADEDFAAASNVNSPSGSILDIALGDLRACNEVNTLSVFALAQEAVRDFKELPQSERKTFIFTGNGLDDPTAFPNTPLGLWTASIGKSSTAHFIDAASQNYGPLGYKFYYLDERLPDGAPAYGKISGDSHAEMSWSLSQEASQSQWRVRFANGIGRM